MNNKSLKETALEYFNRNGCNVLALNKKMPLGNWRRWNTDRQTAEDILAMDWDVATGIGIVSGINNVCVLDFDKVIDENAIAELAVELGLEMPYSWSVKSGSGKGFHLWMKLKGDEAALFDMYGKEAGVIKLRPKATESGEPYEHLEIRIRDCQTVAPPSMHESGRKYIFLEGQEPNGMAEVDAKQIVSAMKKFCVMPENVRKEINSSLKKNSLKIKVMNRYEEKKVHDAIKFLVLVKLAYDEWFTIGMGLASLGEVGRKYFLELSLQNEFYKDSEAEVNKKFDGMRKDYDGRINLGSVFHIATVKGMKFVEEKFWFLDRSGNLLLVRNLFIDFLSNNGFYRWYPGKESIFIRKVGNIVDEVYISHIQDFVFDYIRNVLPDPVEVGVSRSMLLNAMLKAVNTYFGENFLRSFPPVELDFQRDTAEYMNFYYSNCYVQVSATSIVRKPYQDMSGCIWKESMLPRAFERRSSGGDFREFIFNICGRNDNRFEAFMSMYGYMLHHFKIPSLTKAVILTDEKSSSVAAGGTGKSIIGGSLKYFRKWQFEDGKNFDFRKGFPFQKVEIGDQVLFFNDIGKGFDFERLFNLITDDWTIEKKHRPAISINKEDAPKIIIATNHMVRGSDESHERRQYVFALADFYGAKRQPKDDFEKEFFGDEWEERDWCAFDNFGMECAQLFLKRGLISVDFETIKEKRLAAETHDDFVEFIKDVDLSEPIKKKNLLEMFKDSYPGHDYLKQNSLSKWVEKYAEFYGFYYDKELKFGNDRFYQLIVKG